MTQVEAVRAWWDHLDDLARRRMLRLDVNDVLPRDVALDLAMYGVAVVPLDPSPDEAIGPAGWGPPLVPVDSLDRVRDR